jgi:hypothetical protein
MTTLREAAQQALEALEELNGWQSLAPPVASQAGRQAAINLRAALEQPEQEPVAWMDPNSGEVCRAHWLESHAPERDVDRFSCPLYTHPPRREWRSLSEEEIQSVIQLEREKRFQRRPPLPLSMTELSHAIEAALRSKNYE